MLIDKGLPPIIQGDYFILGFGETIGTHIAFHFLGFDGFPAIPTPDHDIFHPLIFSDDISQQFSGDSVDLARGDNLSGPFAGFVFHDADGQGLAAHLEGLIQARVGFHGVGSLCYLVYGEDNNVNRGDFLLAFVIPFASYLNLADYIQGF